MDLRAVLEPVSTAAPEAHHEEDEERLDQDEDEEDEDRDEEPAPVDALGIRRRRLDRGEAAVVPESDGDDDQGEQRAGEDEERAHRLPFYEGGGGPDHENPRPPAA